MHKTINKNVLKIKRIISSKLFRGLSIRHAQPETHCITNSAALTSSQHLTPNEKIKYSPSECTSYLISTYNFVKKQHDIVLNT